MTIHEPKKLEAKNKIKRIPKQQLLIEESTTENKIPPDLEVYNKMGERFNRVKLVEAIYELNSRLNKGKIDFKQWQNEWSILYGRLEAYDKLETSSQ